MGISFLILYIYYLLLISYILYKRVIDIHYFNCDTVIVILIIFPNPFLLF